MTILTAIVAPVQIGHLTIEGLLDSEGGFHVAIPQMAELNLVQSNLSLKRLEASLGITLKTRSKLKTEFNRNVTNAVSLAEFELILKASARKGNQHALDMVFDLVSLSLHQLFSDAFGIKFEKEERQLYLQARTDHRDGWRKLYTDWQQKDGCVKGWEYANRVIEIKIAAKLPTRTIETYDAEQVRQLTNAEVIYDAMRRAGKSHQAALQVI